MGNGGMIILGEALQVNRSIESLRVAFNNIYDCGLTSLYKVLVKGTGLKSLDLEENYITDTGFDELVSSICSSAVGSRLEKLNVRANRITDASGTYLVRLLGSLPTLTLLNLNRNCLGDRGSILLAGALKTNTTLKELNLASNRIRDDGCIKLAECLLVNRTLHTLDLHVNLIGDEGIAMFAATLEQNNSLSNLDFTMNIFTVGGYKRLADAVEKNNVLQECWVSRSIHGCGEHVSRLYTQLCKNGNTWLPEMMAHHAKAMTTTTAQPEEASTGERPKEEGTHQSLEQAAQ